MKARAIPNILTLMRLIMCPVFMTLASTDVEGLRWTAWVLVVVALATDVVDGALARKYGWVSKIGVYLDPAVDKIVLLTGFYQMTWWGWLPLWVPVVLMSRELIVNSMRSGAAIEGKLVAANWMGKTKALGMSLTMGTGYFTRAYYTVEGEWFTGWLRTVQGMSYAVTAASVVFGVMFVYLHRRVFFEKTAEGAGEPEQKSEEEGA
ncbi:MAG: CDP-alcohol phosphatidyltransferase family protein [Planctomycetes bacterium]|nr:CDP-alcohol phosphatidyltransferase family protein [Planctomycetota bacterium]